MSYPDQTIAEYRQRVKELEEDLFAARQALIKQGLELRVSELHDQATNRLCMFMRQKIECALTCHPNAVKYLLEEAIGKYDEP